LFKPLFACHQSGHDTTSSAISFTLFNIAKHAEVQQKCIDEIRSVIGDDPATIADMQ